MNEKPRVQIVFSWAHVVEAARALDGSGGFDDLPALEKAYYLADATKALVAVGTLSISIAGGTCSRAIAPRVSPTITPFCVTCGHDKDAHVE